MSRAVGRTSETGWGESGIVTPEGVILDFDRAGVASRFLARVIDLAVIVGALSVVGNVLSVVVLASEVVGVIAALVLVFLALFAYPALLEAFWRGRTVGKYALGLRVVTVEGASIRFRHSAVRSMMQLVDIYATLGGAAVVAALSNTEGQRLGDMAAGTYVVRERRTRSRLAEREVVIPPPWGHHDTVAALDTSGLDVGQAALVRSFLVRVTELEPVSRAMLASELADRVSERLGRPTPSDMHPETWLACVAAAVQQRGGSVSTLPRPGSAPALAP